MDDSGAQPEPPDELRRYLHHLEVERRLAPRTLVLYGAALARLQRLADEAGVELHSAQTHHLRRFAAALRLRERRPQADEVRRPPPKGEEQSGSEGLGPRSVALTLSAWRGLYRWWGREGLVFSNPVTAVRAPKAPKLLPKALSVEQAVALADHESDHGRAELKARDHAIVELLYGAGLRVGELTGLDLQPGPQSAGWIDLAEGTAHVLGKGSKRRSVPVGRAAVAALRRWCALRSLLAKVGEAALFVSQRGTRLTAQQLRKRLRAQALDAGVPTQVHPHMLRHSFASHLLQSSGDLRAVQELLGHAHIGSTQVYTQLDFQHLAKVYDAAHPRAKRSAKP